MKTKHLKWFEDNKVYEKLLPFFKKNSIDVLNNFKSLFFAPEINHKKITFLLTNDLVRDCELKKQSEIAAFMSLVWDLNKKWEKDFSSEIDLQQKQEDSEFYKRHTKNLEDSFVAAAQDKVLHFLDDDYDYYEITINKLKPNTKQFVFPVVVEIYHDELNVENSQININNPSVDVDDYIYSENKFVKTTVFAKSLQDAKNIINQYAFNEILDNQEFDSVHSLIYLDPKILKEIPKEKQDRRKVMIKNRITNYKCNNNNLSQGDHQNPIWYIGNVCRYIIDNKYIVSVNCLGSVGIYNCKDDNIYSNPEDLNITNDKQLKKALRRKEIEIVDYDKWFEISITDKATKEQYLWDDKTIKTIDQALDTKIGLKFVNEILDFNKNKKSKTR